MKLFMKILLFILIEVVIFYLCNIIFLPEWIKDSGATLSTAGIYQEKENSLDVVFVGSSNIYNGVSPLEIWNQTGIASYSYASPEQKIWLSYYAIKELLNYQTPKVIVLDMNEAFSSENFQEDTVRKLFDNMKLGKAKLEGINDKNLNLSFSDKLSYIFPVLRYHTRWNDLSINDFKRIFNKYDSTYKGYVMSKNVSAYEGNTDYMKSYNETVEMDPISQEYLNKILELCNNNNIELLLIDMPSPNSWSYPRHEAVKKYAQEHNIKFLELNCIDEININWETDTQDKGWHLNINGARKVSSYIAEFLKENYDLQDHRNEDSYKDWNNDLEIYLKDIEN